MTKRLHEPGSSLGDWPEDFHDDNGKYVCKCHTCGCLFWGYKRRVTCKACDEKLSARADKIDGIAKQLMAECAQAETTLFAASSDGLWCVRVERVGR